MIRWPLALKWLTKNAFLLRRRIYASFKRYYGARLILIYDARHIASPFARLLLFFLYSCAIQDIDDSAPTWPARHDFFDGLPINASGR